MTRSCNVINLLRIESLQVMMLSYTSPQSGLHVEFIRSSCEPDPDQFSCWDNRDVVKIVNTNLRQFHHICIRIAHNLMLQWRRWGLDFIVMLIRNTMSKLWMPCGGLQETALNHVGMSAFVGDGMGATHAMIRHRLIWVVTRMHVEVDRYPVW